MRREDVLDLVRLERALLLVHDRLHEVDVDALELGQVQAAVDGQQATQTHNQLRDGNLRVQLFLALVLGREALRRDVLKAVTVSRLRHNLIKLE